MLSGLKAKKGGKNTTDKDVKQNQTTELSGGAKANAIGKEFENKLTTKLSGTGSFKAGGREFDGKYIDPARGQIWYEAKAGGYWENQTPLNSAGFNKFKSDIGSRANIARQNGAHYEVHSQGPIPGHVKDWLKSKNIPFREH